MLFKIVRLAAVAFGAAACSTQVGPDTTTTESTAQNMSTTIHTTYGLTTFGGPGDYQSLACTNESSRYDQPWYVASSQRYGCGVHLKLTTAAGKCVVARTDDAGPASYVESRAGIAVMDSSPAVTEHLFGVTDGLGESDLREHPGRYDVEVTTTTLPLGPCDGSDPGSSGSSSGSSSSGGGSSTSGGSSSGGASCAHDGDCNPGDDGAGLICERGSCVPGCHSDAQCGGNTSCVDGQCE